jgi:myo-inositol-1(or 4)-monophosphatase
MNSKNISKMFDVACKAATETGEVLSRKQQSEFFVSKKGRVDLVTEMDLLAEGMIVDQIRTHFPEHQILAEERGESLGSVPIKWIIDPLDGTTNYAHGYRFFCVSIGVEVEGEIMLGVVYDPICDELFSSIRGGGAELNGQPISVSEEADLLDSLLCTGFSYGEDEIAANLKLFNQMVRVSRSVRRDGSAALDLCYIACGRFEGFWELSLNPWDVAAGTLIIREAGGLVSRFDGSEYSIYDRECLATNGRVHQTMSRELLLALN